MSEAPPNHQANRPTPAERDAAATELSRVRDEIDALDKELVELLNRRAALGRQAGHAKALAGRRAVHDPEREREVLLRVAMANAGPLSQADLLSIYRRIVAATRSVEHRDRDRRPDAG
ncbi:MAG TPA: chorismate mutase [Candidatus Limnocylindrales bacterium]